MAKVMVFGTFDILHKGHLYLLKNARKYGDELIAVVARDETVKRVKKRLPLNNEKKRLSNIKKIKYVDNAILGGVTDRYRIIREIKPEVICLGYDQMHFVRGLNRFKKIKIIRLEPYKPQIYKSSIIRKSLSNTSK